MPLISIVIPVYKAEDCLHELHKRLVKAVKPLTKDFEIVLVEDCGGDNSWRIIEQLAAEDSRIKGIRLSRNFGQHYAITAGLDYCQGDWVVVMDCDLQDAPEEIPRLYAKVQEGFDVVLACRTNRKDKSSKRLASKVFYKIFSYLADMDYDPSVGNFRIISRKVADTYRSMRENLRFFAGMINWMGFPTAKIDVEHGDRFAGESTYTLPKLIRLATDTIIAYSDKPLRLSVQLGFLIAGISVLMGSTLIIYALVYDVTIPGWSSLMVSIFLLGGIIIANLGIIGIYLGKTFDETKKRPLYIISDRTFDDAK